MFSKITGHEISTDQIIMRLVIIYRGKKSNVTHNTNTSPEGHVQTSDQKRKKIKGKKRKKEKEYN